MSDPNSSAATLKQFDEVTSTLVYNLAQNSKRAYEQTFKDWKEWCIRHKISPLDIRVVNVNRYLIDQQVSYNTRRRHLSALRKLAETVVADDPTNKERLKEFEQLQQFRVPQQALEPSSRKLHELTADQASMVLAAWNGDKLIQLRNRALVALLFMTGMRRSEVSLLQRQMVDLDEGVILVEYQERLADGSTVLKQRSVAIPGDAATAALRTWVSRLEPVRNCIFPSIDRWGNLSRTDEPMSDQAVYDVVKQTQALTGLIFTPQDARRTFLTELLENGSPILDVKAQAGHKDLGSTLNYAKTVEAKERRKRLKLRYGSNK